MKLPANHANRRECYDETGTSKILIVVIRVIRG